MILIRNVNWKELKIVFLWYHCKKLILEYLALKMNDSWNIPLNSAELSEYHIISQHNVQYSPSVHAGIWYVSEAHAVHTIPIPEKLWRFVKCNLIENLGFVNSLIFIKLLFNWQKENIYKAFTDQHECILLIWTHFDGCNKLQKCWDRRPFNTVTPTFLLMFHCLGIEDTNC